MTTDEKLDLILSQQTEILELLRPKKKKQDSRPAVRFEEWWKAYPKHINKSGCLEKWKARKLDEIADIIISDTNTRKIYDVKWQEGYIPNSTTYLNQSRWESEIETRTRSAKSKSRSERVSDAIFGPEDDCMDLGQAGGSLRTAMDQPDIRRQVEQDHKGRVVCEAITLSGQGHRESDRRMDGRIPTNTSCAYSEAEADEFCTQDIFSFTEAETK